MLVAFTQEMVFSFGGPNLCLLGSTDDFKTLAALTAGLTNSQPHRIDLKNLPGVRFENNEVDVIFSSKPDATMLGQVISDKEIRIELDPRYWERLFNYFVLMSWNMATYYLNNYENCLDDLELEQEFNFICSSEFNQYSAK